MRNIAGWEKRLSERGANQKERTERGEIPRWEENKQLIKGTGLETQRKSSSSSFFFAILLRNLWVICCRGKTFCLPPLKNRLNLGKPKRTVERDKTPLLTAADSTEELDRIGLPSLSLS